jgi:hypothetical protein
MDKVRKPSNTECYAPSSEPLKSTPLCVLEILYSATTQKTSHRDRDISWFSLVRPNNRVPSVKILKVEMKYGTFSKTLVSVYETSRPHIAEDRNFDTFRPENLKSHCDNVLMLQRATCLISFFLFITCSLLPSDASVAASGVGCVVCCYLVFIH